MKSREVETILRRYGFELFLRKEVIENGGVLIQIYKLLCLLMPRKISRSGH